MLGILRNLSSGRAAEGVFDGTAAIVWIGLHALAIEKWQRVAEIIGLVSVAFAAGLVEKWLQSDCSYSEKDKRTYRCDAGPGLILGCVAAPLAFAVKISTLSDGHETLCFWRLLACSASLLVSVLDSRHPCKASRKLFIGKALGLSICVTILASERTGFLGTIFVIVMFEFIIRTAFQLCRCCFSLGEGAFIASILAVLSEDTINTICFKVSPSKEIAFIEVVISSTLALGSILYLARKLYHVTRRPIHVTDEHNEYIFWILLLSGCILIVLPMLCLALRQNVVTWIWSLVFSSHTRVLLCLYWVALLLFSIILLQRNRRRSQAVTPAGETGGSFRIQTILVRKVFHLLVVAMFVPAIIYEKTFLAVAFAVAVSGLLLLEYIRLARVQPLGPIIDSFMKSFIDHRDSGPLILTHLYLLLGCAIPVWLSLDTTTQAQTTARGDGTLNQNQSLASFLAPFSGVIILGIGDALASYVGVRFGSTRWPGTQKTVEGTVGAILGMGVSCGVLAFCWCPTCHFSTHQILGVAVACIAGGWLEAFTTQIDNLFLPIIMWTYLASIPFGA
mmetsp:Transcript_31615/g.51013  ORF Transcript_31615/g.51013 Transcript_31615/m.51013 type:complete len:562 (+) Transcript_31615:107-1792(+)